jgi:3-oxoacyl-(acyl-carrier-protein) synthase
MKIYIRAAAQISIQNPLSEEWFENPIYYSQGHNRSLDPDFKPFVSVMEARRMGRVIKRAIATSKSVVPEEKRAELDAILTGTGLGSVEDTEKFLDALLQNNEEMLPPSSFMNSTHNTIGSQIALNFKCHGYNSTCAHRGTSFDNVCFEAYMHFLKGANNILLGGYDEMTPAYYQLFDQIGFWKKETFSSDALKGSTTPGTFSGETAMSFWLSSEPSEDALCRFLGIDLFYKPSMQRLDEGINSLLRQNGLTKSDIDAVVMGYNGDVDNDKVCAEVAGSLFPGVQQLYFKHLFGDSFTMSAMGLYLSSVCLKRGEIPMHIIYKEGTGNNRPRTILLHNHYQNRDHSIMLLSI